MSDVNNLLLESKNIFYVNSALDRRAFDLDHVARALMVQVHLCDSTIDLYTRRRSEVDAVAGCDLELSLSGVKVMVQLLLTEERREDPLIVTFDTVVREHRFMTIATRDTNERTSRIVGKR